ncbi:MAG: ABC transporter ATP-binding protein [Dehalococcoidia bacterium]|nr:ABC transporter ATP-binding protein [Dehalococcoidia bacterium]
MSDNLIVETRNLTKTYGKFTAVNSLNLRIEEGEVFGLLGPNGAGKTTTILMLMGFCEPTSGSVLVNGYNPLREPIKVKSIVGYMPEKIGFYDDMTARENLEYTGRLNGLRGSSLKARIDELFEVVGLRDRANQPVGTFSHGMKQRLGIADVMIKRPKIAILDEPTSGIDPEGTDQVLDLIKTMAQQKVTVIISSHLLHQLQKVCTGVGIFSRGQLIATGSVDKLGREALRKGHYHIILPIAQLADRVREEINRIPGVRSIDSVADSTVVAADDDISAELGRAVLEATGLKLQMKVEEFELEDIYKQYFKGS